MCNIVSLTGRGREEKGLRLVSRCRQENLSSEWVNGWVRKGIPLDWFVCCGS